MSASYTYSLTYSDVIAELPGIDGSNIGAATEPVGTGDITQWINDASAKFNAVLLKSGITPSASLDADAHDAVAAGIKAWAVEKCLRVISPTNTAAIEAAKDTWQTAFAQFSNAPQDLGDAYTNFLTCEIDSNDTGDTWSFVDNEGTNW